MNKISKDHYRKALKKMYSEAKEEYIKNLQQYILKAIKPNIFNFWNIFGCPRYGQIENNIIYENEGAIQGSKYQWRFSFKDSIHNDFNIPNDEYYKSRLESIDFIQSDYIEIDNNELRSLSKYLISVDK